MLSVSTSCLLGKNVFTINCPSETTRGRFKEIKGRKDFKLENFEYLLDSFIVTSITIIVTKIELIKS